MGTTQRMARFITEAIAKRMAGAKVEPIKKGLVA